MSPRERENEIAIHRVAEHINGMELRLKFYENENAVLAGRIDVLEKENADLRQHIRNYEAEQVA